MPSWFGSARYSSDKGAQQRRSSLTTGCTFAHECPDRTSAIAAVVLVPDGGDAELSASSGRCHKVDPWTTRTKHEARPEPMTGSSRRRPARRVAMKLQGSSYLLTLRWTSTTRQDADTPAQCWSSYLSWSCLPVHEHPAIAIPITLAGFLVTVVMIGLSYRVARRADLRLKVEKHAWETNRGAEV